MKLLRPITLPGLALVLAASAVSAQAPSPYTGTWKIDLAKSKYSPSELAPQSGTTRVEVTGATLKATVDVVDAKGRKLRQEYTATLDGKDTPCGCTLDGKPNPDQDAVSWKKIDDHTFHLVSKLKGQTTTTQHVVIAADGRTRTNTVTGKNAQGQTINNTVVYVKQ